MQKWKKNGEAFTQQLVQQSKQRESHKENEECRKNSAVSNCESRIEVNWETELASTKPRRLSSGIWKRLNPFTRRSSNTISSHESYAQAQTSPSRSDASITNNEVQKILPKAPSAARRSSPVAHNLDISSETAEGGVYSFVQGANEQEKDQAFEHFLEFLNTPSGPAPETNDSSMNSFVEMLNEGDAQKPPSDSALTAETECESNDATAIFVPTGAKLADYKSTEINNDIFCAR